LSTSLALPPRLWQLPQYQYVTRRTYMAIAFDVYTAALSVIHLKLNLESISMHTVYDWGDRWRKHTLP